MSDYNALHGPHTQYPPMKFILLRMQPAPAICLFFLQAAESPNKIIL
jgi:hypothetical protein